MRLFLRTEKILLGTENIPLQHYCALHSTTPILLWPTKYFSSTTEKCSRTVLYHKVLLHYYTVLDSIKQFFLLRINIKTSARTKSNVLCQEVTINYYTRMSADSYIVFTFRHGLFVCAMTSMNYDLTEP